MCFIREARDGDREHIIPLAIELFKGDAVASEDIVENFEVFLKEQWEKVDLGANIVFVAEIDGTVVGYLMGRLAKAMPFYTFKYIGYVNEFFVNSSHRGQGIGRLLLEMFESTVKDDTNRIQLNVSVSNPAIPFYNKEGFRPIGHRMQKILY